MKGPMFLTSPYAFGQINLSCTGNGGHEARLTSLSAKLQQN